MTGGSATPTLQRDQGRTPMTMCTDAPSSAARDPRLALILARDTAADGGFWYGVTTTGVYCRPSCRSRAANAKNMRLFDTVAAAEAAGFRACRRCNPNGLSVAAVNASIVARACRSIAQADSAPSIDTLAASADLSPAYFHRLFKSVTGVTPGAYAAAHRADRVRRALADAGTVTQAIYAAGFNSNGRFYASSGALLGMTPSRYRAGGARETLCFAIGQCSLGAILVASSARGVAAILIGDDADTLARDLQDGFPHARLIGGDIGYETLVATVVGLVEAPHLGCTLPLDIRGTAFQQRVWQALQEIPAGSTASYTEIAARIGRPGSVRAVAGACAANTLAVAIPCHRVVRRDGGLSGYRWGIERKRALVDREAGSAARRGVP